MYRQSAGVMQSSHYVDVRASSSTLHLPRMNTWSELLFNMPGLDRSSDNKDSAEYCGRKNPIPKVGKGSGILDENGVS